MKTNLPKIGSDAPYVSKQTLFSLNLAYHKVITGDQDRVYVITGREGSGKSTLALAIGYRLDPNLSLKNVVFNSKDFEDRVRKAKKHEVIIFDECFNGLSSKAALSKENRNLVRLLMECRQRNLFIFLVLPSFFLLEKYAAIFRSTALFHIAASKKNFKQRFYKVYNYEKKKYLFLVGKKDMSYYKPKIIRKHPCYGKFPPTIDRNQYIKKKEDSFRNVMGKIPEESRFLIQRDHLIRYLYEYRDLSMYKLSDLFEDCNFQLSFSQIQRILADVPQNTPNSRLVYSKK